jgi:hypothetical protein
MTGSLTREFIALPSADGYLLELPQIATELRVERLRRDRGELIGELSVSCGLPGTRSADGGLSVADFNLSSARARTERAKILVDRSAAPDIDWSGLVEDLCQRVLAAERNGRPAILLRDLPRPTADEDLNVGGLRLLRRHPVCIFGDGGALKSYLGLWIGAQLARRGLRVLYADWEFAGEDHRDRLERIEGEDMPELWYLRAERPTVAEVDRLRRIVREERIDYAILDSVAFACDGPPEAAEVAASYFRAVRRIGVGSLHVAHVNRSDTNDQKPFGSTFWHNGFRSTWFAKRSDTTPDSGSVTVGLYNRKANLGPLLAAVGYRVTFGDERTTIAPTDLADVTELAAGLPLWQRMVGLLRTGSMTMVEMASDLDVKVDSVSKAVRRGEHKVFTRIPGPDGIYRIGLLTREAAA